MIETVKSDVNDAIRINEGVELKSGNGETWKSGGKMIQKPGSIEYSQFYGQTFERFNGLQNIGPQKTIATSATVDSDTNQILQNKISVMQTQETTEQNTLISSKFVTKASCSKQHSIDKIKIHQHVQQGFLAEMVDTDFYERRKSTLKQSTLGRQASQLTSSLELSSRGIAQKKQQPMTTPASPNKDKG